MPFKKKNIEETDRLDDELMDSGIVEENIEDFREKPKEPQEEPLRIEVTHNIKLLAWLSIVYTTDASQTAEEYKEKHAILMKLLNNPDNIKLFEKPKPQPKEEEKKPFTVKWMG